jgi:hypothetical protein
LEGILLPSFRFSWKLKKLCRFDFFVFESWQTAEDVMVLPARKNYIQHGATGASALYTFSSSTNLGHLQVNVPAKLHSNVALIIKLKLLSLDRTERTTS